ncbi:hypothetical protein [Kibdelosporangium phytohabitans]|uniref:Phosphopantetheine adenylyltransferase n=1 Tax=Kibdelosporangium phytohabitans TaxID=860235 RepID=A0A0N7F3D4_9PSEU|nr:hypothetical protein [Kibdelosporangium phytohabitans]ALG08319.1 hypothetical protein AOZ06_16640 [Kibdelosporangium phytohabitans]MBE1470649.1 hypothetical protein [Kibdelosporangium phytohabitans]
MPAIIACVRNKSTDTIGRGLLVIAALINMLPGLGAVSVTFAQSAYGVEISGPDMTVLMRHRATLFAVLGACLLVSVFRPHLRTAAVTANAVSLGGFVFLVTTTTPANASIQRIAWIDVVGLVILALGAALAQRRS